LVPEGGSRKNQTRNETACISGSGSLGAASCGWSTQMMKRAPIYATPRPLPKMASSPPAWFSLTPNRAYQSCMHSSSTQFVSVQKSTSIRWERRRLMNIKLNLDRASSLLQMVDPSLARNNSDELTGYLTTYSLSSVTSRIPIYGRWCG
jgi:hypothetical protein